MTSLWRQLFDRVGRGRHAQHVEEDLDGVMAIHAGAVVDVVCANYGAGKLLQQVALFVCAAGRIQKSYGIRPMAIANLLQAGGNKVECLVPRYLVKLAIASEQWSRQAVR